MAISCFDVAFSRIPAEGFSQLPGESLSSAQPKTDESGTVNCCVRGWIGLGDVGAVAVELIPPRDGEGPRSGRPRGPAGLGSRDAASLVAHPAAAAGRALGSHDRASKAMAGKLTPQHNKHAFEVWMPVFRGSHGS